MQVDGRGVGHDVLAVEAQVVLAVDLLAVAREYRECGAAHRVAVHDHERPRAVSRGRQGGDLVRGRGRGRVRVRVRARARARAGLGVGLGLGLGLGLRARVTLTVTVTVTVTVRVRVSLRHAARVQWVGLGQVGHAHAPARSRVDLSYG